MWLAFDNAGRSISLPFQPEPIVSAVHELTSLAGRPSCVSITLNDGAVLTAATIVPKGDAAKPLTPDERREKVRLLIAMGNTGGSADEILAVVDALPGRDDLAELGRLLRAPSP